MSSGVEDGKPVVLGEIDASNIRAIAGLSVSESQRPYVASNALSVAEAYFETGAWFRAIRCNDMPVGFVMLFDHTLPGAVPKDGVKENEIGLWRLMIDHRFQGQGIGRRALDLICAHARTRPGIDTILSSYVPGPHSPVGFYKRYGFTETESSRGDDSEIDILLKL